MAETKKDEQETVPLYNPNRGIHGRDGGPYLDEVEAAQFERLHAAREGKKPNLDNPRPYPGVQLVTSKVLVDQYNSTLLGGDDRRVGLTADQLEIKPDVELKTPVVEDTGLEEILPVLKDTPEEHKVSPSVVVE